MIAVIDYGAGNLRSVANAIARLGFEFKITSAAADIDRAGWVILPGVGAAADTMAGLRAANLVDPICQYISAGRPFLGVCVGLQVLLGETEEGGRHPCLNVIAGNVRRLPAGVKIPHIGWNQVRQRTPHAIFKGIPDDANFYFVHSYFVDPSDRSFVAGETEYGSTVFCSVIARGNLVGTQFHPEKSGETGLCIYRNFLEMGQR